jgi:Ring finger domain
MSNLELSAVAIITRPPEIIACVKLRLKTRNVFIIFDSHPRPSYPNGAGMTVNTSIESTARRLTELLPTVDLPDSFLQWQAQLLANYSGHIFVPHGAEMSTPILWQAVLESSLAQLSMQAELADLRSQNDLLKDEQQRLESEIKEAEVRSRRQERQIQQLELSATSSKYHRDSTPPRHMSSSNYYSPYPSSSRASTSTPTSTPTPSSPSANSRSGHTYGHSGTLPTPRPTPPFDREDNISYAMRLQRKFDEEDRNLSAQRTELARSAHFDRQDGISYAMRLQREFDEENRALSAQRTDLAKSAQRVFKCSICMEEMPVDSIARVDTCGHTFCRECLREYVATRLDEHRFPILCPTCTANKGKGKGKTGGTYMLARQSSRSSLTWLFLRGFADLS